MNRGLEWLLASRRRVVLVALLALLVLDLGRSLYARVGYAQPAEPWQEAPYEAMAWPPSVAVPAGASLGEQVYIERCAICHGPDGEGNGPAAPSMIPRPRDFTLGQYKYKSTAAGQPPTNEDLMQVVANGLQASAMPYWHDVLSQAEIEAVVAHVKSFSPVFNGAEPVPIKVPPRPAADEASIAQGEALYVERGCGNCHGIDLGATSTFQDSRGYPVHARDLTAPWTFRGGSEPEEIWLRITTGLAPSPMPAHAEIATDEERWHIVNYVLSQARTPPWEPGGELQGPGFDENLTRRGQYLVHAEMCGLCHTQVSADMRYSGDEYYLAGGMGIPIYPHGVYVSRNLTPDPETGLGNWSEAEIAAAIRNGRTPLRMLNFWGMPWMFLHSLSQEDALAIASYLKSRSPVQNQIPLPLRYGVVESIVAKIAHSESFPPIASPERLVYKDGNYGRTEPGVLPHDWPQQLLVALQWLVLLLAIGAFVIAAPPERRFPRRAGGWIKAGLVVLGLLLLGLLAWVVYDTPALGFIPPQQINQAVTSTIPVPDAAAFSTTEEATLAERGRYLFTITSCAFCHGSEGAGGLKISARDVFGTVYVRNISSDAETGIGNWSDAEIARAIRSGIARDGRWLHWQGMIWDHLSNLDEEDVRALIVYLRTLPPVENEVPTPRPPAPDDCEEYTFYLVETEGPGCE
ncbi:MAG TPA: c-type cytochrome [Anaerolineae bacterium]